MQIVDFSPILLNQASAIVPYIEFLGLLEL